MADLSKKQQVTQSLENSSIRCLGTYLINLPVQFEASHGGCCYYQSDNNNIATQRQYLLSFKQMITLRE
ncbi:hypothetical protein J3U21_10770 [Gilliamella sp. B2776]|uniref:hypothetical protein n=1 Tax=unclassified Gilliamella TaxID=2685620 RepID=UPI002269FAFD|nr:MULTISPECIES: hypothetical protein [unclassified Gilliamella]MCX8650823.1 hypothetical protein [Gilliamella sp. B2779]MCX8654198.1 hypothetical protein [Gilliamella sp. B2737]MCX8657148.1 hypothetical protein [Gilliamella sp. B2894]MCX8664858.1 hypothetical protein [Gilliamella sp. B2887]MCX8692633.1 hypothetical protein [Gilliamella sp. B2776]